MYKLQGQINATFTAKASNWFTNPHIRRRFCIKDENVQVLEKEIQWDEKKSAVVRSWDAMSGCIPNRLQVEVLLSAMPPRTIVSIMSRLPCRDLEAQEMK
jgi:hypothetical protein